MEYKDIIMKLKNLILKICIFAGCFFFFSCAYKLQISHIDNDVLNDSAHEKLFKSSSDAISKLQEILKDPKKKETYPDALLLLSIISCYNDSGNINYKVSLNYLNQLISDYPDTYYSMSGGNIKRLILKNMEYYNKVENLKSSLSNVKKELQVRSDELEKIKKDIEDISNENTVLKTENKHLKDNIKKSREIDIESERKKQDIIVE